MISELLYFDLASISSCKKLLNNPKLIGKWKTAPVNKLASVDKPYLRQSKVISGLEVELINNFTINNILKPLFLENFFSEISNEFSISHSAILEYNKGDFLRMHSDKASGMENRLLSFVTYLNDGFEGGETYFPMQDKKVIPKTGRTIIFPSELLHESCELLKGTKYAHIFFITIGDGEDPNFMNYNQLITKIYSKC